VFDLQVRTIAPGRPERKRDEQDEVSCFVHHLDLPARRLVDHGHGPAERAAGHAQRVVARGLEVRQVRPGRVQQDRAAMHDVEMVAGHRASRAGQRADTSHPHGTVAMRTSFSTWEFGSRREGPRRGLASLMQPLEAAPDVPFVMCRYAEARTRAAAIIAACLLRWHLTSFLASRPCRCFRIGVPPLKATGPALADRL
jgi:hypothetical protein